MGQCVQSGNSYTHARAHEAICFFVLEILLEPIIFLFIPKLLLALSTCKYWWPEVELNHRHTDFQSVALPTELSGQRQVRRVPHGANRWCRYDFTRISIIGDPPNHTRKITMFCVESTRKRKRRSAAGAALIWS